jgi:hypothetical protein
LAWSAPVLTVVMIALVATLAVLDRSELETRVVRSTLPEGTALPQDLVVGECVMLPEGKVVREVPVVPCAEEHDAEVFAVTQLDAGPFPGRRKVMEEVGSFCLPAFEEFAGQPYRRNGRLGLFLFYPMEATWADDRGVTCLILDTEGPTTGTLRHTHA